MGGRPAYMGGVPMLFCIITLLGLAMGLAQRGQRLALLASGEELRGANVRLEAEMLRRERLEERLIETQRMESLGRMAAGVAHDFNNVLTVVRGHADLLLRHFAPGSAERQGAEAIGGATDRGAELTRQLLAFAARQELAPTEMDPDRALGDLRELLASLAGRQTQLVLGLGARGREILADPTQFAQVIMNLAVNARDAMPEGGRLVISTAWIEGGAATSCACEGALRGGHVAIAVTDSGSGIPAETLPRIFEPFFTTKGPGEGTGLGLATVHGIVQQSGGHIAVESRPGAGTAFRICWPGADEGAAAGGATADVRETVKPA
jgi:signal transduction histidine kinase